MDAQSHGHESGEIVDLFGFFFESWCYIFFEGI